MGTVTTMMTAIPNANGSKNRLVHSYSLRLKSSSSLLISESVPCSQTRFIQYSRAIRLHHHLIDIVTSRPMNPRKTISYLSNLRVLLPNSIVTSFSATPPI